MFGALKSINEKRVPMSDSATMTEWQKSSFCADGYCVEVAKVDGEIAMRDGKKPEQPWLFFTMPEWDAFITGVSAGEFQL